MFSGFQMAFVWFGFVCGTFGILDLRGSFDFWEVF